MFLTKIQVSKFEAKSLKLDNSYKWHQAVWQAFPSNQKKRTFLFRVDEQKKGFDVFLFSENPPTPQIWGFWELQKITNIFWTHQTYRFKLLANPTIKKITMLDEHTRKKNGRRVGITEESELIEWLQRKAENSGFEIIDCSVSILGAKSFYRKKQTGTHFAVDFCGDLLVSNKTTFIQNCVNGIGSAKTFGFGLLLLEPSTHTKNTKQLRRTE